MPADMLTLLIATRNLHKVEEIRAILGTGFRCLSLKEFPDAPEVLEDAPTFAGNATKKSVQLAKWLSATVAGDVRRRALLEDSVCLRRLVRGYVLADDSGLEVDALNGAPGVHSARFAALDSGARGNSSAEENNAKLLRSLKNVPSDKRTGRFRCVLALTPILPKQNETASPVCAADEFELQTELFEGSCEGRIGFAPRGKGGFGYDPLFSPDGYDQTFSELGEEIKNHLSHRAKALEKVRVKLRA